MVRVNQNYLKLPGSYLFSEVARRIAAYSAAHPEAKITKLSIGDVTRPLVPAVVEAMHKAVDEMGTYEGFHGYGPEQGYPFLREAIAQHDYAARGMDIKPDEIFVSDGAKSDCGNIGDIFGVDNVVAVCDPVYPVYVDRLVKSEFGQFKAFSLRKSPHVLRHTVATELLDEGADLNSIKEMLGHSSLAATQVYTHNSIAKLKSIYESAHPRAKNGGKNGD